MTRKKANRYVSAIIIATSTIVFAGCGTIEAIGLGVEAIGGGIGRDVQSLASGAQKEIAARSNKQ